MYCRCLRCNHYWKRRTISLPERCPRCNSPYWNKKRRKEILDDMFRFGNF